MFRHRCGDKGTRAKSCDGKPGDHAAFVRKPFDQSRHWHDVTQTEADAAEHAVTEVEQPQVASNLSGEHHTQAVAQAYDSSHTARAAPLHPQTTSEGGNTEHENRELKSQRDLGHRPSIVLGQRNSKDTPGIDSAEGELHHETCGGDQPS